MADAKTNAFETSLLQDIFRDAPANPTRPTAIKIGLFTASPGEAGSVSNEVNGVGYARVAVTQNDANWNLVSGVVSNANAIPFAVAGGNWGTITDVAVFGTVGGVETMHYYGSLTDPKAIDTNDQFQFQAGTLTIGET